MSEVPTTLITTPDQKEGVDVLQRKLVIDAGAFISRVPFDKYGSEYYTLPEVLSEIRDSKAKQFLNNLLVTVQTREPSSDAYTAICEFAKKTGDFPVLSKTDLRVLALAYTLEKEVHGSVAHLKTVPGGIQIDDTKVNNDVFLPVENADDESAEQQKVGFGEYDSDDEDGWITPSNVKDYTKGFLGIEEEEAKPETAMSVSCMTTDFAMQNVLLQMGLHLTSVDGMAIKRLQLWALRCFTCYKICKDMEKKVCPECGNSTLKRVQYSVDKDGKIVVKLVKKHLPLKGTIFSVPLPKGGRVKAGQPKFPSSRNPNEPRKRIGKKNKSRRIMGT